MTERPTRHTEAVRLAAATAFAPKFIEWLDENRFGDQRPMDVRLKGVIHDVLLQLPPHERDAFRLACAVEAIGYDGNAELVDLMDEWDGHLEATTREEVARWVTQNDIQPWFKVGDKLNVIVSGVDYDGTIHSISRERAEYVVNIQALGHVPAGQMGTSGIVFTFERLHGLDEHAAVTPHRPAP